MESNGSTVIVGAALALLAILLGRPAPEREGGVPPVEIAAAESMRTGPSCRVDVLDDSGEPLDCAIATTRAAELAAQSAVTDAPSDLEDARPVEQLDAVTAHASVVL